ncbi:MAG: tape measure protein [Methylovulum sp.]|nr:tape measure protein [Methylovulum sp.]
MSTKVGLLTIEMAANIARLETDMRRARNTVDNTMRSISRSASMAMSSIQGLIGVMSVRELAQISDQFKTINATLALATRSAEAGAVAYEQVLDIAMRSGQAIEGVAVTYRRFAENSRDLGITQDQVARSTETVAQALALSGGSYQSTSAALVQFGQALASGTLRGQELNSVLEQAPRLARLIADGMNVSVGALRSLAEKGKITTDVMIKAIEDQASTIEREFGQLPMTFARAVNNFQTAVTDLVGNVEKNLGVFGALAGVINLIAQNLSLLVNVAVAAAITAMGRFAVTVVSLISTKIALAASMGAATAATITFNRALAVLGGPAGAVITAASAAYAFRSELGLVSKEYAKAITATDEFNEGIKATGGFWSALVMLGTTNPFSSLEEQVSKYRAEVEKLKEEKSKLNTVQQAFLNTAEKLERAQGRLSYFEALLAKQTRASNQARQDAATGTDTHTAAYTAMITSADELVAKMHEEFSLIGLTNEERAVSIAMRKLEELGIRSGTEAFEKYLKEIIEIQRRIRVKKEWVQLAEDSAKAAKREAEEYDRLITSLKEKIATIELENETSSMTNRERERAIFLRELENVKIQDRNELLERYDEATLIKEANALREKGIADRLKSEEDFAKDVQKINDQIGQSLTDALMDGGRSAKDFLISMFKTIVLRPLLQPIITGASGLLGLGAAGSAMAGGTGAGGIGTGSITSMGSLLSSAYNMVTSGFSQVGTMASTLASTFEVASTYGTSLLSQQTAMLAAQEAGLTSFSAAAGSAATALAGIGAGLTLGNLISGDKALGGSSWFATGGGTAIGAAIGSVVPVIGTAIGAVLGGALGGVLNAAFGSSPKEYTDMGISGTLTAMAADVDQYLKWKKAGGWFSSTKRGTELEDLNSDLQNSLDASLRGIGGAVELFAYSLGQPTDAINAFSQSINLSFKDLSEQEIQQKIQEALSGFESGLIDAVFPALRTFAYAGETQGETLKRLSERLSAVNQVFAALDFKLNEISMSGASAANTLIELVGGIESFVQKVDFYYQNFYTVQERLNKNTDQLTQVFAQLGMALPTTREAFRAVMDLFQQAGSPELVATLLNSAGAFNEYITALEETQAKAKELADLRMQEGMSIETQLFQLLGMTAELRKRELDVLDESNRGLQQHIYTLQDAQAAYDAAAAATSEAIEQLKEAEAFAAEIKARRQQESASIENKLFQLLGQVSILRDRETDALDDSNNALQRHVYTLEDAQAAYTSAVDATNKAFDQLKQAISVELQAALNTLTKDFESFTDSLTQQQQALEAVQQIASENFSTIESLFKFIGDQIDDLVGTTGQTVMAGMSFIKSALITAQTTGYLPEQEDLSGAISAARGGLSSDNFGSAFEMRRANLLLANDLSALRSIAGSQMTDAQTQIAVAEQQLEALKARLEQARTQYEDSISATNSYYEAQLIAAQQQINVLNGINESVLSVGAATNNLAVAMGEQRAATVALANANAAALIAAQQAAARREAELAAAKAAADEKARVAEAAAAAAAAIAAERARQEEAARVALAQANAAAAAAALQAAANREAELVAAKAAADEKARLAEAAAQSEAAAAAERARQQEAARVAAAAAEAERQRLAAATAAAQAAAEASRSASIAQMYREILGREPDAPGLQYWMSSGESLASIRNNILLNKQAQDEAQWANNPWFAGDSGAATGGYVSPGMMLVGEEGPELVNFRSPGMVYSSAQTQSLLGGSGGDDIIGELRSMREDQRAQAKAVVALQSRMTRVIERWEGDGLPSTRYEGATA